MTAHMGSGRTALVSGCIAFIVATTVVRLLAPDRDGPSAMTIGGLTGGAVALSVWLKATHAGQDGTAA